MDGGEGEEVISLLLPSLLALTASLAALGFLHQELDPLRALLAAVLAVGVGASLRGAWARLPRFVSGWLEAGTVVTVALIAVAATGASRGLPYAVLRWQEMAMLGATAALAGTATASLGYTHHRLLAETEEGARRLLLAEKGALESQLSLLSAQINPHFLFNTLNALAEIVHEDEDQAEDLITDLAAMMRYALKSSTGRVALSEEIEVVQRFLRIEAARLGPRLTWRLAVAPEALEARVPGLLLQPLVENAVRHGVSVKPEGGSVEVEVTREGDQIFVRVSDDGPGLPPAVAGALGAPGRGTEAAGGGLRSVALRAALAWPAGQASLVTEQAPSGGARLLLSFPANTQTDEGRP